MNKYRTALILKFAAGILSVFVVGCIAIVALALWDHRERRVTLNTDGASPLNESQAIELSREVLKRVGEDASLFEPAFYDHADHTKFFARNADTPTRGYVLWHSLGDPRCWNFIVLMEQVASEVHCEVARGE